VAYDPDDGIYRQRLAQDRARQQQEVQMAVNQNDPRIPVLTQRAGEVLGELRNRYGSETVTRMEDALSRAGGLGDLDAVERVLMRPDAVQIMNDVYRNIIAQDDSPDSDKAWSQIRAREREQHRKLKGR
jgi:hypothetical protein